MIVASKKAARLLHDGTFALAEVERQGVRIDVGYLDAQIAEVESEIADLKKRLESDKEGVLTRVQRTFGNAARINSREQLGTVIFDQMGFKRGRSLAKKTLRQDEYGRTKAMLDEASFSNCPLDYVKNFFAWKKLEKLLTTYFYDIRRSLIGGRVHANFHLNRIVSYRSSCSGPNLQNIPSRNRKIADRVRRCYIPDPGCAFVDVDYGLAEVRSACCYTNDPVLIEDFTTEGKDAHGDTAEMIFQVSKKDFKSEEAKAVWKKGMRDWAKNRMVFPQFFGSTYHNCGPHIWDAVEKGAMMPNGDMTVRQHLLNQGITELGNPEDAKTREGTFLHRVKQVEQSFWDRFQVFAKWKRHWYAAYLRDGYCKSLSGFVYSGLVGKNDIVNYPIQGFAFHWTLWDVVEVLAELKRLNMRSRIWNEIHDSTVANVPVREIDDYCDLITEVMTVRCPRHFPEVSVDLVASVEVSQPGTSWADKKDVVLTDNGWEIAA